MAPSENLARKRIRNRLMEVLELISEYDIGAILDINELVNLWDDWTPDPFVRERFPEPIFTLAEQDELLKVDQAIETFCRATPQTVCDERSAIAAPEWRDLVGVSKAAVSVFAARGRLSEDEEKFRCLTRRHDCRRRCRGILRCREC